MLKEMLNRTNVEKDNLISTIAAIPLESGKTYLDVFDQLTEKINLMNRNTTSQQSIKYALSKLF